MLGNYLALNTCGESLCVAACKNGKRYVRFIPDCVMKQSVLWLSVVDEVLREAELTIPECDFLSAVVGAGSFTGIRIGISAIKGLALAHGKKTLPITSFDVIAYNALNGENKDEKLLCLVDALHGAYYACGYKNGEIVLSPRYITEAEALSLQAEGYTLCATSPLPLSQCTTVRLASPQDGLIQAVEAKAAAGAFAPLTAVYVRKSSAELNVCK